MSDQTPPINLTSLCYYFDGTKRDSLDRGSTVKRIGAFMALRDRLLGLSDEQFELVIKTVQNMLTQAAQGEEPIAAPAGKEAVSLYQETNAARQEEVPAELEVPAAPH